MSWRARPLPHAIAIVTTTAIVAEPAFVGTVRSALAADEEGA